MDEKREGLHSDGITEEPLREEDVTREDRLDDRVEEAEGLPSEDPPDRAA